jgi:protoheme IX farnesyltransferase
MEQKIFLKNSFFPSRPKKIISLTKPGIIMGNLIPTIAGFLLANKEVFEYITFFQAVLGVILIIASGCTLNNIIDKDIDAIMERTKNRPMPKQEITSAFALIFGILIGIFGLYILFRLNLVTGILGCIGLFVYVVLYSMLFKRKSVYSIHIGSISGAIPPLIGYTASTGEIDTGGVLLFLILVFWQMPHSFAISIFNAKDYAAAAIPTTYVKRGVNYIKKSMIFYVMAFTITSSLLTFFSYTGPLHLISTAFLGGYWLSITIKKFEPEEEKKWARKVFFTSIIVITLISISIAFG